MGAYAPCSEQNLPEGEGPATHQKPLVGRPKNTTKRRQQIVDGLLEVMAEKGYEKASINNIAEAAGLASGLVHYHFKSKQAILLELLRQLHQRVQQRSQRLVDEESGPRQALRAFISARLGLGDDADPRALACWVAIGAEALRQPEVGQLFRQAIEEQRLELLEILRPLSAQPESHAASILAAIEGYYQLAGAAPETIPEGSAAEAVLTMAEGLLASRPAGIEVPQVRLKSGYSPADADFVHALVAELLRRGGRCLHSESGQEESVEWLVDDETVALSPKFGHYRAALAAFGFLYLGGQPYGGRAGAPLHHDGGDYFYNLYMSNNHHEMSGFWLRFYVKPTGNA